MNLLEDRVVRAARHKRGYRPKVRVIQTRRTRLGIPIVLVPGPLKIPSEVLYKSSPPNRQAGVPGRVCRRCTVWNLHVSEGTIRVRVMSKTLFLANFSPRVSSAVRRCLVQTTAVL